MYEVSGFARVVAMAQAVVQLYRIELTYFATGGSSSIIDQITVEIDDDDAVLNRTPGTDPGTAQSFTSDGHSITAFSFVFNTSFTYIPAGSSTPVTVAGRIVSMTIDGQQTYWLMADSGPSAPGLGVGITVDKQSQTASTDVPYQDIACFAAGTLIETPEGPKLVETIRVGDLVLTEDNGPLPVRWIGAAHLSAKDLAQNPKLLPIRIAAGAFGPDLPKHDLILSPQHRILLTGWRVELFFGDIEVLVAIKQLLTWPGVSVVSDCDDVSYYHLMFDQHEIVHANGMPAESFYLGDQIRDGMDQAQVEEILTLFPELAARAPVSARRFAKGFEAIAMA